MWKTKENIDIDKDTFDELRNNAIIDALRSGHTKPKEERCKHVDISDITNDLEGDVDSLIQLFADYQKKYPDYKLTIECDFYDSNHQVYLCGILK